ncbi:MAG: glycosyltransferase family 2 protein [Acidobacteriota bacterium]|jgi:glycosyltransferase involved in cell wall biosynthesis|nr:glycosyltransferase family 2 protein [Acidobacteriota bacterium]
MKKEQYDLVIVIPVGLNCKVEYISDTIDSIKHYCLCPHKIILYDDSQKKTGEIIKSKYSDVDILRSKKRHGLWGGLYISLSLAFKYAIDTYSFKVLMRMDTDALITGFNPQVDAIELFEKQPEIGIAGLIRSGLKPKDSFDNVIDNWWPRMQILTYAFTWRWIRRPVANRTMRKYAIQAFKNGYEIGENIFGGAYFVSECFLKSLDQYGLLPKFSLRAVRIEEDHIFSMLAKAIGFEFGDLESGGLPLGVAWRGLPASPEAILRHNKKIIHSTRYWDNLKEPEIRAFFKQARNADTLNLKSTHED